MLMSIVQHVVPWPALCVWFLPPFVCVSDISKTDA